MGRLASLLAFVLLLLIEVATAESDCSQWTCRYWDVKRKFQAVRRNAAGNIECLSGDGHGCYWRSLASNCKKDIRQQSYTARPEVCTKEMYEREGHWCSQAEEECAGHAPEPVVETAVEMPAEELPAEIPPAAEEKQDCSQWICYKWPVISKFLAIRRNKGGDIECLALDGKECLWRSLESNCQKDIRQQAYYAKPLVCTKDKYEREGHWCAAEDEACKGGQTSQLVLANVLPKEERDCFEYSCYLWPGNNKYTPIRRNPGGNIECLGTSGKQCEWRSRLSDCEKDMFGLRLGKPLVCDDQMYGIAGHWCALNQCECEGNIPVHVLPACDKGMGGDMA